MSYILPPLPQSLSRQSSLVENRADDSDDDEFQEERAGMLLSSSPDDHPQHHHHHHLQPELPEPAADALRSRSFCESLAVSAWQSLPARRRAIQPDLLKEVLALSTRHHSQLGRPAHTQPITASRSAPSSPLRSKAPAMLLDSGRSSPTTTTTTAEVAAASVCDAAAAAAAMMAQADGLRLGEQAGDDLTMGGAEAEVVHRKHKRRRARRLWQSCVLQ